MYIKNVTSTSVCDFMYMTDLYVVTEYMHSVFENLADFEPTRD